MATPTMLLLLADGRFPAGAHAHSAGLEAAVAAGRVTDLATLGEYLRGRLATAGLVAAAFTAAACRAAGHGAAGAATVSRAAGSARAGEVASPDERESAGPVGVGPDVVGSDGVGLNGVGPHGVGLRASLPADGAARRRKALARLDAELDARTASPAQRAVSRRQGRALLRAGRRIWPEATFDDLPAIPGGPHQPLVLGLVGAAAGLDPGQVATVAAHATVTGSASAAVRLLGLDPYQVQGLLVRLAAACDATATRAARAAEDPPERLPAAAAPLADMHAEAHATWEVRLFAS
ncbi:urease accessory UreF family protein [Micromonospora sp. WMMD1082]|uniref:urease accessory protein UreF n=1 Tax=Micromonospora sp. WMMD1082 TaxID=3016104 RepID=UPI002416ADF4|nr:urease accessory UreF family protein [Micromonospora sp. WMMD1082]MDG4797492.1 urease accessory UreF family protein [Micromonospora sp. WMMD1082]